MKYKNAPPFGKFDHLESFVRLDQDFDDHVEVQFNVYVRLPHAHICDFMDGMEQRGWVELDEPMPNKKVILGKYGFGLASQSMPPQSVIKVFERTSEVAYTICVSEFNPKLCKELEQRARRD